MVLQWAEGLICLVAGLIFAACALRIRGLSASKALRVRRAASANALLWAAVAAGSFLLTLAAALTVSGWEEAGDVARSASALSWGIVVIPLFYLYGYLILREPWEAHLAGAVGAVIFAAGSLALFRAPRAVVEVAEGYRIQTVEDALTRFAILSVVLIIGAVVSAFLWRISRDLEGLGRWRSVLGTLALSVFVLSMLVRLAWQVLAATFASRFLLLASALLLYWGYFLPPRHYLKGERKEDGRVQP